MSAHAPALCADTLACVASVVRDAPTARSMRLACKAMRRAVDDSAVRVALKRPWPPGTSLFARMPNLESLDVDAGPGWRPLLDMSPVSVATKLTHLSVRHVSIEDLTPLALLPRLKSLRALISLMSDAAPLSRLTDLRFLDLHDARVRDVEFLRPLTRLTSLAVSSDDEVLDVRPLSCLANLSSLSLARATTFEGGSVLGLDAALAALSGLTSLDLRGVVVDGGVPEPIASLTGLVHLTVHNHVTDLTPLSGLSRLRELELEHASETHVDLAPLRALTGLTSLNLAGIRCLEEIDDVE